MPYYPPASTGVATTIIPGDYGDGSDGVINFDGTTTVLGLAPASGVYTLTRDIFLASGSQVSGTAVIKAANFRIFCNGTFTIGASAVIHNDGNSAVGAAGGTVIPAGTTLATLVGGAGGAGTTGGAGTSGTTASLGGSSGGSGGASGGVSGAPAGGGVAGNASGPPAATSGAPRTTGNAYFSAVTTSRWNVGASAPGGTAVVSSTGGGGGSGGGVLHITAYNLVINGTLRAAGGNGGAASGAGLGAGGGGGGAGGGIVLVYCSKSGTNATPTAATNTPGGTGGLFQGVGKNGLPGAAGSVWFIPCCS